MVCASAGDGADGVRVRSMVSDVALQGADS